MLIYLDLQLYLASFKRDLAIEITNSPIINSQVNLLDFMQFPPYCLFMAVCSDYLCRKSNIKVGIKIRYMFMKGILT